MALTKIKLDDVDPKATPVLADSVLISDSEDGGRGKLVTGAAIKALTSGNIVHMDDLGCVADDDTDNFSTIRTAIQSGAGKTLQFGDGTYKLLVDATAIGTLPSGITIRGTGKDRTVLRFAKTTSTYLNLMTISASNNIVFEDLTLQCDYDDTISGNFFSVVSFSNVRFTRCKLIGQGSTTTANNKVYLFSLNKNTNTRTGFLMEHCDVSGWVYVFLKANDAVSVDYDYTIRYCTFEDNITGNINFNSPLGETVGFVVDHCKIYSAGPYLSGTGHLLAFAGVEDLRITNNSLYGESDWEAIHLENINQRCIIANNSIKVASFWSNDTPHDLYGSGIWVNRNTTIGRMGAMDYLAITGNIIQRYYTNDETSLSGTGISLAIDAYPATTPATNVIISGNLIRNFKNGFEFEVPSDQSVWTTGNIIIDCTAGVRTDIDQSYFGSNKWVNCGAYTPENWEVNT